MKGLKKAKETCFECLLCERKDRDKSSAREYAQIGLRTPAYRIGDRVLFQLRRADPDGTINSSKVHEGVIINFILEEGWLKGNDLVNDDHQETYLYGYQIRLDNGHIHETGLFDEMVELLAPSALENAYETNKKVFSSDEFRREMKKHPGWKAFVTPRFL